jgi:hypothetical protein
VKKSWNALFISNLLILMFTILLSAQAGCEEGCTACHADASGMAKLGYSQFIIGPVAVQSQSKMHASCEDCHLGDPSGKTVMEAHTGMLTLTVVDREWKAFKRWEMPKEDLLAWGRLEPRGQNRASVISPKLLKGGKFTENPEYRTVLWQDKNPLTLAFNPVIAEKTCGRCHAEIVQSYLKSPMGGGKGAHTQSQYSTWTGPAGPQSCGLWMGVLSKPAQETFSNENIKRYAGHSTMPIADKAAFNNQRTCNQCHVGCLDCHLNVQKSDPADTSRGRHTFVRKPVSLSCYGGGRSFSCHAGPLERRRGDGYFRAEFAQAAPGGKEILNRNQDIHMQKGIECVDCHEPNIATGFHADLKRKVDCSKCHEKIVKSYSGGPHKKVDCAACHLRLIGGYAFNFWSAVGPKGNENPLTRIQDYTVSASKPLIIKNPDSLWIPVHVVPHTSGNVKAEEVKISGRLLFRDRPDSDINRLYFSNDSYAITGLARAVDDKDHDAMVWLNLDRVAHALGKARPCEDCHSGASQVIMVKFSGGSYKDVEDGEYKIEADTTGLRVTDFKGADGASMPEGLKPFADKWALKGDFSLPAIKNKARYETIKAQYKTGIFIH